MYTIMFLDVCGYSHAAKELLDDKNLDYKIYIFSKDIENGENKYFKSLDKEYKVGKDEEGNTIYEKKAFKDMFGEDATFPRVYKGDQLVGGYTQLDESLN